ncbi:hypothetical protein OHU34_09100 [Streptomyces sp. NBC_00080]
MRGTPAYRTTPSPAGFSKQWFKNSKVEGLANGSCFRETDGELIPLP